MEEKGYVQSWRWKHIPVLSPEELLEKVRLIHHPSQLFTLRNQALISILYLTAGRCSEIVGKDFNRGIKRSDITQVTEDDRAFTVFHLENLKNPDKKMKDVPVAHDRMLDKAFLNIIDSYLEYLKPQPENKLFCLSPRRTRQLVNNYFGSDCSTHYFRHMRLTHLTQFSRLNQWELMQIAGWRSPEMAMHYIHADYRTLLSKM